MGVTVKKCHMIMPGNDCWNSVCFSCCRKADNELADVTLSGRLFTDKKIFTVTTPKNPTDRTHNKLMAKHPTTPKSRCCTSL